jgi:hypothetical protein
MANQILIANANLRPVLEMPNVMKMRIAAGTAAHTFSEGSSAILVAQMLSQEYKDKDIQALYHGLMDIDGFVMDYSHHGPSTGARTWLSGNVARYYLQSLMLAEITAGRKPPNVVMRGHFHEPICERVCIGGFESWIVVTPALCMMDDHSRQATRSKPTVTVGMLALEIVDGKMLDIQEHYKTIDIRTKEKL